MKLSLNFNTKGLMRTKLRTTFYLIKPSDVREIVNKSNEILKLSGRHNCINSVADITV